MSMENLKDLYKEELKDVYNAEQQILKALPKLIKACQSEDLREALENHLEETEEHKTRLEQCLEECGLPAKGKMCDGMKGIITEGDDAVGEAQDDVIDATIIAAAQKVEHYEIATYGCLRAWAEMLGMENAVSLLQQTLDEEKAADAKLTEAAESFANAFAAQAEGTEDEDEDTSSSREEEEEGEMVEAKGKGGAKGRAKTPPSTTRRRDRATR
jgi:ferritin-like metal-binding protein YciE